MDLVELTQVLRQTLSRAPELKGRNKMILYGSQTSPYVRRLRLLLPETAYQFKEVDIFSPSQRDALKPMTPLLKVPFLTIGATVIWDSRVIFGELVRRGFHPPLTIHQENLVTAISDCTESLIQMLLARRSKVEFPAGSHLAVSHGERISNSLEYLDQKVRSGDFADWSFPAMCLYSLVDWIVFRELASIDDRSALRKFAEENRMQDRVLLTDPRKK